MSRVHSPPTIGQPEVLYVFGIKECGKPDQGQGTTIATTNGGGGGGEKSLLPTEVA